jgi:hypothetical protein
MIEADFDRISDPWNRSPTPTVCAHSTLRLVRLRPNHQTTK